MYVLFLKKKSCECDVEKKNLDRIDFFLIFVID